MEKAMNASATGTSIQETTSMGGSQVKDCTLGRMETHMMVNGWMALNMAMVCGKETQETAILVSGHQTRPTVTGFMNGEMGIVMKVNGSIVYVMVKEATRLPMGIVILENTTMVKPMAMASTNGQMGTRTREYSMKV